MYQTVSAPAVREKYEYHYILQCHLMTFLRLLFLICLVAATVACSKKGDPGEA